MSKPDPDDAWDRYWAYGNLHSFSQVAAGNYDGVVGTFWRDFFHARADGDRILDIATGNGAIPLLAREVAAADGRHFDIVATDLAAIDPATQVADPAWRAELAAVRFCPRTPAEALPFDAETFDCVSSQFGLEYSDLARSLPEIGRVLRPGGAVGLVMHHARSAAVEAARRETAQLAFVLDDARVFALARKLLRALADLPPTRRGKPPAAVARKRAALDRAIQQVEQEARSETHDRMLLGPLNYVREVLTIAERKGPNAALGWLDEARSRMQALHDRLAAMQAAALTEEAIGRFTEGFPPAGLERPAIKTLSEHDDLVGWQILTRKTAP